MWGAQRRRLCVCRSSVDCAFGALGGLLVGLPGARGVAVGNRGALGLAAGGWGDWRRVALLLSGGRRLAFAAWQMDGGVEAVASLLMVEGRAYPQNYEATLLHPGAGAVVVAPTATFRRADVEHGGGAPSWRI
jgi:hypothetical protein